MPKSVTVHATPGTRKQWNCNQCVMVSAKMTDCLVVTSGQNRSTPGLYTRMYLKQNTNYTVEVKGCSYHGTKAFVWIYDPRTKLRLIPNYTFLPRQKRGVVHAHFCSPKSANEYVNLHVGVLFTGPVKGQQFEICHVTVGCTPPKPAHSKLEYGHGHAHKPGYDAHGHAHKPGYDAHGHAHKPGYDAHGHAHKPGYDAHGHAHKPGYDAHGHRSRPHHDHSSCDDSHSDDSHSDCHSDSHSDSHSENEVHIHHHESPPPKQQQTRDPYYTYDTHPTAPVHHHGPSVDPYHQHGGPVPVHGCPKKTYHPTHPPTHPPVHPPYHTQSATTPHSHSSPAQGENYRIDDLQQSLDTMIQRMKTA